MGQEYPPEKDTKHSAPAPLRRRLHEFYFGGSLFVVLRAANRTAPDLSFRTPPRGATACRENVFLLLANTLASVSQLCRTRIIKGGKKSLRKFLRPRSGKKLMVNSQTGRGGLDTITRGEQTRDGDSGPLKRAKKDCGPKNRVTVCMVSYELNELKKNF